MKQGLAGAEKGHSLGRSQGSLYGNKEELYDRLKRHAYQPGQGKKGEWYILWMLWHVTHPPFFRQEQCKRDDKWFWRCSSVKRIHVRRLPGVSVVARMLHRCLKPTVRRPHPSDYHKPRKHKLYPRYKVETLWGVRTSWICNVLNAQLFGWCL